MSNIFKSNNNNRFNFLDDSEIIKKNDKKDKDNKQQETSKKNYFKNNENNNDFKKEYTKHHDEESNNYNDFKVIEKKNKKKYSEENKHIFKKPPEEPIVTKEINILEEDFPDLSKPKSDILESTKSGSEKIYKDLFNMKDENKENKDDVKIEEFIPDGCICITYDKINRKINYKQGKMNNNYNKFHTQEAMNKIAKFYAKRKNNYINLWGLDTYEETFLFKNYDYEYFDKLDIEYEIEMEKLNEELELEQELEKYDDYGYYY
jgi:hypothetical protein